MKKLTATLAALFVCTTIFAQSDEYLSYLEKAKDYEAKKQWAFAMNAYYDALNCDDEPQLKEDAFTSYNNLRSAILSGNPGIGKFNVFTIHDEWKNLLIEAEKLGSSFCRYDIIIGDLVQGDLDYTTRTATYQSQIQIINSNRYDNTIKIIHEGYQKAYKSDWTDLVNPENWPLYSVSHSKDGVYNENGVLIYSSDGKYYNAFAVTVNEYIEWGKTLHRALYDVKFNIVDTEGKELVKGKRLLIGTEDNIVKFTGIKPEIMDLIDNGQAFINLQTLYLEYGCYNKEDDKGGRTFIKNFPEVELSANALFAKSAKDNKKIIITNFTRTYANFILNDYLINIPDRTYKIGKTEVTQKLYELVMDGNPSSYKSTSLPVTNVSWYDAIYFCNRLSIMNGKNPVYAVDGKTDITEWNYTPHKGNSIRGNITQNTMANGYRLPTNEEWEYAARGVEYQKYSGSDNLGEVAWHNGNSGRKPQPVGEKKANGYGLYDMTGNVWEWIWDQYNSYDRYIKGGGCQTIYESYYEIQFMYSENAYTSESSIGFRLYVSLDGDELEAAKNEIASNNEELIKDVDNSFIQIPEKTYKIGKTEVTQKLYELVMGENPSYIAFKTFPVTNASWYDAIYFCNKLSMMNGKDPVYAVNGKTDITEWDYIPHKEKSISGNITQNTMANGYRLPTNDEWEYAASGGEYQSYSGSNNLDEFAWHNDNSGNRPHSVGEKKANAYGLFDMTGNVWEWVSDKDTKGGCYTNYEYDKSNYIGFRLSISLDGEDLESAKKQIEAKNNEIINEVDNSFIQIPGKTYKIGKTEVTQRLYEAVMDENPSYYTFKTLPVENVSWYDAIYFCNKLSMMNGKNPVYAVDGKTDITEWNYIPHKGKSISGNITQNTMTNGYRLPTNGEWEYAARGGEYQSYSGSNNLDEVAWYDDNSRSRTHPVGEKKANGYGLFDMNGNVNEWVWEKNNDSYDNYSYNYNRGGSFDDLFISVTYNSYEKPYEQRKKIGFRLSASLEGEELEAVKHEIELKNKEIINEADNSFVQIPGMGYKIGITEVTQSLYEAVMGENPSFFAFPSLPVENVSWYDAIYFCNKLSVMKGKTPVYAVNGKTDVNAWNYTPHKGESISVRITLDNNANGYRLPTNGEWEFAARGGETFKYAGSENIYEVAWYNENSEKATHRVGEKKANGYGLYDMSGNVQEWIWNDSKGYSKGGSWDKDHYSCEVTDGARHYPYDRYASVGFRLLILSE